MKIGGYIKNRIKTLTKFSISIGHGSNNEAEYLALIELLTKIVSHNIKKVKIFGDAKLIIDQVNGDCKNNKLHLQRLALRANLILKQIPDWELTWIKRSKNKRADALSKQ